MLPLLKEKLQYRAQGFNDSVFEAALLAGEASVKFEIASRTVKQKGPDSFPVHGGWTVHEEGVLGVAGWNVLRRGSASRTGSWPENREKRGRKGRGGVAK